MMSQLLGAVGTLTEGPGLVGCSQTICNPSPRGSNPSSNLLGNQAHMQCARPGSRHKSFPDHRSIKCGKPNCRCANGEGHQSLYLSSYYNGKTQLDSVPKAYKDKVSQCIKDYEDTTELLAELSRINLELFRRREIDL